MTLTRPRLTAALLCLLLAVAVILILWSARPADPRFARQDLPSFDVSNAPSMPSAMPAPPPAQAEPGRSSIVPAPAINPGAAPGIAFNYRYAFRLPAARVAAVQERHAQLCEHLTLARCRIAGVYYRVIDARQIEARLELRLDPRLARSFGRTAGDAVARADGMLIESEIGGTDAAAAIRDAGRSMAELGAELARIEARLSAPATRPEERPGLDDRAQQLRAQIRSLRDGRDADRDSLATTPMLFQYGSGIVLADRPEQPTLAGAAERAFGNFLAGMTILAILLVTLLPWALALLAGWALWRAIRRRWPPASPASTNI